MAPGQEVRLRGGHLAAEGGVGVQVVAKQHGRLLGEEVGAALQPPPRSRQLAILLLVPVLRHDELRRKREHRLRPPVDEHGGHAAVAVGDALPAVGELVGAMCAVAAVDFLRGVVLGPVEGDDAQAADPVAGSLAAPGTELPAKGVERRVQRRWGHGVEGRSDAVVRRNPFEAEDAPGVALSPRVLHGALVGEKGRTLREKHAEGGPRQLKHGELLVLSRARIGEFGEHVAQPPHVAAEDGPVVAEVLPNGG